MSSSMTPLHLDHNFWGIWSVNCTMIQMAEIMDLVYFRSKSSMASVKRSSWTILYWVKIRWSPAKAFCYFPPNDHLNGRLPWKWLNSPRKWRGSWSTWRSKSRTRWYGECARDVPFGLLVRAELPRRRLRTLVSLPIRKGRIWSRVFLGPKAAEISHNLLTEMTLRLTSSDLRSSSHSMILEVWALLSIPFFRSRSINLIIKRHQ